jgi:murein DD-endopeptidase MepM/ murein hydrolase activator NlpD
VFVLLKRFFVTPVILLLAVTVLGACSPHDEAIAAAVTPAALEASPTPVVRYEDGGQPTVPSPLALTPVATSTAVAALPTPEPLQNPRDPILQVDAETWQTSLEVLDGSNTGYWQFAPGTFLHPVALEVLHDRAYLIDGGRVLSLDLDEPQPPEVMLNADDMVQDVRVLEPLDLAQSGESILVLDRAGDVYRYDVASGEWSLDRYDRPSAASSGHYFVALDTDDLAVESTEVQERALLETNYKFVQLYGGERHSLWNLDELRSVDVRLTGGGVFVLQREMHELAGRITLYRDTSRIASFKSGVPLEQPRQLLDLPSELLVLDRAGRRLVALDPDSGQLRRIIQPPQDELVTAVAYDKENDSLLLAGRDRLYFAGQPDRRATVVAGDVLHGTQAHDFDLLRSLDSFIVPIGGSNITFRDFQLPGAPRHYRLGVHNGIDLYWQPGTGVRSVGDGVVLRADTEYVPPTAGELAAWAADSEQRGYTSPETLDHYMGRQVWIEHAPGVITRYAHLRAIAPGIAAGEIVTRGQAIGEVGNSGSPASLESEQADAHLHFELWLGETHLGQYLRPIETRELVEWMFPTGR